MWVGGRVCEDSLEVFRHAVGLFACLQVCLCLRQRVSGCERERERDKTIIHLFFLVEAFSVTVRYAETSRVEHIADFKAAQDALHLPPAWSL